MLKKLQREQGITIVVSTPYLDEVRQCDRIAFLHEFYGSLAEEMEGDAVAQVCQSFDVPFLDVRIISNSILLNQDPWDLGTGPVCQEYVLALLRECWQDMC